MLFYFSLATRPSFQFFQESGSDTSFTACRCTVLKLGIVELKNLSCSASLVPESSFSSVQLRQAELLKCALKLFWNYVITNTISSSMHADCIVLHNVALVGNVEGKHQVEYTNVVTVSMLIV